MENLRIFENPEFGQVRTKLDDKGEAWFVASDIARSLGYSIASAMVRSLDEDEKGVQTLHTLGGEQKMSVVNESGLYHAIFLSHIVKAQKFRKWVTSVVLPQIRKTGGFIPLDDDEDEKEVILKSLDIAKKTIEAKNAELEAQKPEVQFARAITEVDNDILIRDLAKFLTENGYKIGPARLFYWLRLHHYLYQNETRPYQKYVDNGIFRINASLITTHYGNLEKITTRVTGKGQKYFLNGFLSGKFNAENKNW